MSVKVASNRFIVPSLHKCAELYQHLLDGILDFQTAGRRLVREAELAQAWRRKDQLKELATLLINFPIKEYHLAGQYYLGWLGQAQKENFERIVEESASYKSKALIALASTEASQGRSEQETKYLQEAMKRAISPSQFVDAARGIAIVNARDGFHRQSLKELERTLPLLRYMSPSVYYQYLNSLAVELGEVGRIEEAQNVCRITLASPFINAYPEWRETANEVALRGYKSRSSVPVIQSFLAPKKAKNVLQLPERERSESTRRSPFFQPSDITSLEDWKNKMVKEPNGENGDDTNIDEMSDKDILFEIMNLTSEDDITREQLKKILDAVRKITSKKP